MASSASSGDAAVVVSEETRPVSMMRTASSEGAAFAHPRPDLQTSQGAYTGNVERLEDHAERMSIAGSDIQEEIRKLQLEQKLSDSRRSSLAAQADDWATPISQRSRAPSYASRANSAVDVNQAARWGGYSPNAYINSPVGSIKSASRPQPPVATHRSVSQYGVLGTLPEPASPDATQSPNRPSFEALPSLIDPSGASRSSLAAEFKAIAQDIQEQLDGTEPQAVPLPTDLDDDNPGQLTASPFTPDIPERPPSAGSTNTFQQAQRLFVDFDGVHYAPSVRGPSGGSRMSVAGGNAARRVSGIPPLQQRDTWAQPPPDSNMVYYPAPVPMMLNLPKKLSSRPAAALQAKRREQMLSTMAPQDKSAAPWLDKPTNQSSLSLNDASDGRTGKSKSVAGTKSVTGLAGLPPQLRATMFFDAQPMHHEVEVKAGSAGITLDSILEASASAPVGAFTHHPFAGHQGARVYKREAMPPRRSTTSMLASTDFDRRKSLISMAGHSTDLLEKSPKDLKKRRSSFTLLFGKRSHSTNELGAGDATRSLQASRLTMRSISGGATVEADIYHGDEALEEHEGDPLRRPQSRPLDDQLDAEEDDEQYYDEYADQDLEDDEEDMFAPPTTLLAELQKRKAQQKSRNRTAATAFPNGMHSTLLELDAVEELERKKKGKARVALAWEDPDIKAQIEAEQNDEDVPLGMLYQKQNGVMRRISRADMDTNAALAEADWDRPLGLIERRQLEDNEPLSSRRNRLKGLAPQVMTKRNTAFGGLGSQSQLSLPRASQLNVAAYIEGLDASPTGASPNANSPSPADGGDADEDDEDNIPLAQRAQRLKTRKALSMAIVDLEGDNRLSKDFAGDLLGQFGASETPTEANEGAQPMPESTTPDPEETLGQRRARLQAEKAAKAQRPSNSRRTSASSGDLLNNVRASTILPGTSPSPSPGMDRPKSGLGLNGLRASRSMADLLAAHPLTANSHSARKVSDDQLKHQMPAGSLLAQNEVLQRRNKQRISSFNTMGASPTGMEGPLLSKVDERKRAISGGSFGGLLDDSPANQRANFDRGLLGDQERRQSGALLSAQSPSMMTMQQQQQQQRQQQQYMQQMHMPMGMMGGFGMPMMPAYPSMPNMQQPYGGPMGNMSMYNLPQMQPMQMQMPMQQPYGMMGMQMGNMSTPNFAAAAATSPMMMYPQQQQQPQMPHLQQQQTYAAFAQQQMGMAAGMRGGMSLDDAAALSPEQRDMVHRWRQGIS